ncbi:GtrA family protein [Arcobacter sp. F2176]|uniref:GtrA family protein n=1 Tax=Arcobacter sp. F2176 TaxID=2044511 RepID=UPI00100BA38B
MINAKFIKFIFVGVLNTIFSYIIFVLIFYFSNNKEVTLTLSFVIAIIFNYLMISKYVFDDKKALYKLLKFFLVYLLLYIVNIVHLKVTVDFYGLNVYLAQFLTLLYLPLLSFYINNKYVFIKNGD